MPDPANDGGIYDPSQADPAGNAQGYTPTPDFAALQAYQPVGQPAQAPDIGQPAAVLHAQAASTPPWRIPPDQWAQMQAAGVPDEVLMSIPGRAAA